jgi:antitoxin ParD1/3/4
MQTMNISLPDPMKQYVEEQVAAGAYSSVSEYIRELVRADQKRQAKEHLEQVLLDSINSGDAIEATPEMFEEIRQRIRSRAAQRERARN